MFHTTSYILHQQSYKNNLNQEEINLYTDWFNNNTVDVWRHKRMLECINPFLVFDRKAKWLTVGDGRFGTAARYIIQKSGNAIATDIDVSLLQIAKEKKWISEYKYANAESLPFEDNYFDYSYCKESFHHFPRPYLAVYEMLRVSKKAIIFSEPADWLPSPIPRRLLQIQKNLIKKIIGKRNPHTDEGNFEPIGNYVYSISEREFQKIAIALILPSVAFKRFHDVYYQGVEQEDCISNGPLFRKIKRKILVNNILCKVGLATKNHINYIMFKEIPNPRIINELQQMNYSYILLPKNPYIK